MKKLLDISSEERNRILEMHQSATKRNYLSEQTPVPNNTQTQGIDINGTQYKMTNAVKDAASLSKFLDYNPQAREMQVFCMTSGAQCSGLDKMSFEPTSTGKPSYWTMMKELTKMYLNEVVKNYGNKVIPTACSDSPGYAILYENLEPKVIPSFKQKYGLDDKTYDEFNKYFATSKNYKAGLQSALRRQLNLVGACKAKPNPEQRSFVGQG
ncbi:hypothetical protein UFOVP117_300 [uncultured Caudovirales phage]|uniref:Uncharacterized protein n=1 Tax=uncultured Caudovirales phage TaxID=2100421 RepID=A0A6J5LBD4_9CAUD|nr:hypothetical protein UFOVP117_300 [uncultured Caudovirales phage]